MALPNILTGDQDVENGESNQEGITEDEEFYWFSDASSEDDMNTLKRVRSLTGTNPDDDLNTTSVSEQNSGAFDMAEDSDGRDDIELANSISNRFHDSPITIEPLNFIATPFDADDEDDFEIFRAIQRRFVSYDAGVRSSQTNDNFQKFEQAHENNITLEKQRSICLYDGGQDDGDAWSQLHSINVAKSPNFPNGAHPFFKAIKKNRSCQRFIRNLLIQLDAKLEENKILKERLKILKDYQKSCRRKVGRALSQKKDPRAQLIMSRKTTCFNTAKTTDRKISIMQRGPEENSQVSSYRAAMEKFPLSFVPRVWSQMESNNIAKGIKQQFQQMSFQMSVDLCGENGDLVDLDAFLDSIASFDITPDHMQTFLPKVDWDQLASTHVSGHSGEECKSRWMNWENPLINHNDWDVSEDRSLLKIVQNNGYNNWIDIASLLRTNRTPFQCLARFQRSLNAFIMRSDWSHEEDIQLAAAVEAYGESNWQLVASTIDGRTGTQCSNRWYKTLHPMRKREGRWNWDEDKLLKVTVALMGPKSWNKIAEMVPGRTQAQCRERWVNCLNPSLNLNKWTEEEDLLLKVAITDHGYCWSKIARCVPPRTDNQCRRRWKRLFPQEVPVLQAARKIKKVALVSNFVDRESERPALSHRDFIPLTVISASSEPEPEPEPKKKGKKCVQKCAKKSKKKADALNGFYESGQGQQALVLSGSTTQSPELKKTKICVRKPIGLSETRVHISIGDNDSEHQCLVLLDPTTEISEKNKRRKYVRKHIGLEKKKAKNSVTDNDSEHHSLTLFDPATQMTGKKKRRTYVRKHFGLEEKRVNNSVTDNDSERHSLTLLDPTTQIVGKKRKAHVPKYIGLNEKKVNTSVNDYDSENQCLTLFDPPAQITEKKKRKRGVRKPIGLNEKKVNISISDNVSEHQCLTLLDPTTQSIEKKKKRKRARKNA